MSFDRLAAHYDWMESVTAGRLLQRVRTAWLDEMAGCRRVLSMGEGHGRFAAAFLARHRETELTCVDASASMLGRAKRRVSQESGDADRVAWINACVLDWTPARVGFDGIVTCFFLDCFDPDELAAVVGKLSSLAAVSAVWVNVDFSIPPHGPARWRAAAIHAMMYRFFHFSTGISARRLTPPDTKLRGAGWQLERRREFDWGLLRAELWRREF